MKPKRIQYYETYEETLLKAQRYINAVCSKMNQEEHYNDMQNIGREGLWMAHTRFNSDEGREFHPYAITYIKTYIMNYLTNNARTIRIPAQKQREEDFYENKTISTNTPISDEGSATIEDLIAGDKIDYWNGEEINDEPDWLQEARTRLLTQYISELNTKDQRILLMYYAQGKTTTQIGKELNITRQGASNQLGAAVQKLQSKFGLEKTKRDPSKRNWTKPKKETN